MGQRRHHQSKPAKRRSTSASAPPRLALPLVEKKAPVVYGKPYILLENSQKTTFIYQGGQWVEHPRTIAQYRQDSQVKELPQKINGMTRYEICAPLA